jgi:hypothetical protein
MAKRDIATQKLSVSWEQIDHPNAEERTLSAFELLLVDQDGPIPPFDRMAEYPHDDSKGTK